MKFAATVTAFVLSSCLTTFVVAQGPPDHVLQRFNKNNQVKAGRSLPLQEIDGSTVIVGGSQISLLDSDLTPLDVFAEGARIWFDGEEKEKQDFVFQSKTDSSVTITKGTDGQLVSASKRGSGNGRGVNLDVLPLSDGVFATLDEDDIDYQLLSEFELADAMDPEGRRSLRTLAGNLRNHLNKTPRTRTGRRSLATYDVVEIDVVIDSYLCALYGSTNVEGRAAAIVAETSRVYEVFNVKFKIKNMVTYCNSGGDPIRDMLNSVSSSGVCDLLGLFASYVGGGNLNGDIVHLFHGYDFTGTSTIGCAWVGTLCRPGGYRSGVNEMRFSGNLMSQGRLLAHEAAHNLGAEHIPVSSGVAYIMYPYICSDCWFSETSISTVTNTISNAPSGCIHQENASPTAAPVPTAPAPTPSPTPNPTNPPTNPPVFVCGGKNANCVTSDDCCNACVLKGRNWRCT